MNTIGQHAYLRGLFDQCPIQLVPRPSGQRDDTHPLVGHDQLVSQLLQRVEGGIETDRSLRHPVEDRIGEPEEERIALSEHHDLLLLMLPVTGEHGIEWYLDVNPFVGGG